MKNCPDALLRLALYKSLTLPRLLLCLDNCLNGRTLRPWSTLTVNDCCYRYHGTEVVTPHDRVTLYVGVFVCVRVSVCPTNSSTLVRSSGSSFCCCKLYVIRRIYATKCA